MSGNIEVDARTAQAMLDDPMLDTVLQEMRDDAVAIWTSARNVEQREGAWHDLQAAIRFKDRLKMRLTEVTVRQHRKR